jgi:hypothetical protein
MSASAISGVPNNHFGFYLLLVRGQFNARILLRQRFKLLAIFVRRGSVHGENQEHNDAARQKTPRKKPLHIESPSTVSRLRTNVGFGVTFPSTVHDTATHLETFVPAAG